MRRAGGRGIEGLWMMMSRVTFFLLVSYSFAIGDLIKGCYVWVYEIGGCSSGVEESAKSRF